MNNDSNIDLRQLQYRILFKIILATKNKLEDDSFLIWNKLFDSSLD